MKKILSIILTIAMLAALSGFINRTGNYSGTAESNAVESNTDIREDFIAFIKHPDLTVNDITVHYYGAYSGGKVVEIDYPGVAYAQVIVEETIAGYNFVFNDTQPVYFYKNNTFTELKSAYEKGLISQSDIGALSSQFHGYGNVSEVESSEVESSEVEIKTDIREDFIAFIKQPDLTVNDITVHYYGAYSGGEVVEIDYPGVAYAQVIVEETIAGYYFVFNDTQPVYFYKNNTFTELKSAYEKGLISQSDVGALSSQFHGYDNCIYYYGDIDLDGNIRAVDALVTLEYAVDKIQPTELQQQLADVDTDANITAKDALLILKKSVCGQCQDEPIGMRVGLRYYPN